MSVTAMKMCGTCKLEKPATALFFYRERSGLCSRCIPCRRAQRRPKHIARSGEFQYGDVWEFRDGEALVKLTVFAFVANPMSRGMSVLGKANGRRRAVPAERIRETGRLVHRDEVAT